MLENIAQEIKQEKVSLFQNALSDIFSWKELEALLNLRPFINASRFRTVKDTLFSWGNQSWLTDINTFPPLLLESVIKENLCYIIDCSRVNKKVNNICKQLENIFDGCSADAHIYFTCDDNSEDGFGIHWDTSHNLIVQIEGQTEFRGWNIKNYDNRFPNNLQQTPDISAVLNPGDVAFVPANFYHQAISKGKRLGISFPISLDKDVPHQDRFWIELN